VHKLKQKILTGGLALGFALSSIVSPTTAVAASNSLSGASTSRIYGIDQYETAAKIAQKGWTATSDYAILAAGMPANLIDALAAGPLAAKLNSPILLSEGTELNKNAKNELTRLKVKKVYVTSGSAVIKQRVIDELKTIASVTEVKTLGGYDASHTSLNIAKEMESLGVKVANVVVAGGAGADALSIAPIAGAEGMPILYSGRDSLSNDVLTYLEGIKANLTKTYVVGGTGVISDTVKAQLPGSVERYFGQTQYDTNIEVLKQFAGALKHKNTYVANGQTLVDALAGVPLAVQSNSPILLTGNAMTDKSFKYAQSNLSPSVIGLGGEAVVPSSSLNKLAPTEIISQDGSSKGSSDAANLEEFTGIIKVTGNDVTLKNAKTDYSIYVQGDNATLDNLTVHGTIFLDPGDTGSTTLQNVNAANIVILSGADHSIKLMDVIAALLNVQSTSPNVRVDATGATRFEQTQSSSSAIFEAADGSFFGAIKITYASQTSGGVPVVELIGDFPDTIEVGGGVTVIAAPDSNISSLIVTPDNPDQTVTLSGNFNSVEVNTQANVTLGANTTVTNVVAKAESKIVVPPSSSIKNFDAGSTGTTPTGGGSVGGKTTTDSASTGSGSSGSSGSSSSGKDSGSGSVQVSSVTVSPTTMTLTAGGATGTITPTIVPTNATNKNLNWTSSNETVATVANGVVTPKTAGTTSIVVTTIDGNKTAECTVTVVAAQPQTEVDLEIIIEEVEGEEDLWVIVWDETSDEPILGLTKEDFSLSDASGNAVEFNFNDPEVRNPYIPAHEYLLSPVEGEFAGTYTVTFTKAGYQSISQEFTIGTGTPEGDFTPGEGGTLPTFTPFVAEENTIGGLYITENHRPLLFYYSGDPVIRNQVDMEFLPPEYFGADSYTLQYSDNNGTTWANFQISGEDVTTSSASQDNFSIENPGGDYQYRLLVNNGPKDGYISNVVVAELSTISSKFSGWSLDESMWITGVMAPYIGRGLEASFSATKYGVDGANEDYVNENMTFQWYRVNPLTFEMTAISGATDLTYTTTEADAGYDLVIRATGDGINVGGYAQILASGENKISNKAFVSNLTTDGFTLNLYNSVNSLAVEDLILYDKNWNEVEITSVTPGSNSAIYNIVADISSDLSPYKLQSNSDFWQIVSDIAGGHMMQGVDIMHEAPAP